MLDSPKDTEEIPELIVYGCSDDLIEIEGCITEEFGAYDIDEDDAMHIAFSDGTCLSVFYDRDGIWRFNRKFKGTAEYSKQECGEDDGEDAYSDIITLKGKDLKYAIYGKLAKAK